MQTRKLTLKTERLTELTADELVSVAGAGQTIDLNCINNRVGDLKDRVSAQFVITGCPGCMSGTCSDAC